MRAQSLTSSRVIVSTICVVAIALALSAPRAQADEWSKRTILTVNQPIQVRDRVLEPGTYVFRLLPSIAERHTVQIFNRDQTRIIDTVLAIPRYRMEPADKSEFTFWETPPGTARALRAWFYPGDTIGQEFPYPSHPAVLTASLNTPAPAPMGSPEAETAPAPSAAPAPAAPDSEAAEPQSPTQLSEMAEAAAPSEATPEPQQPSTEPQPAPQEPAPATQPASETLPKTASAYPMIGVAGFLAVGLYGLLRWRRTV